MDRTVLSVSCVQCASKILLHNTHLTPAPKGTSRGMYVEQGADTYVEHGWIEYIFEQLEILCGPSCLDQHCAALTLSGWARVPSTPFQKMSAGRLGGTMYAYVRGRGLGVLGREDAWHRTGFSDRCVLWLTPTTKVGQDLVGQKSDGSATHCS